MARIRGTVKWFNDDKGFGFISPNDGQKDCFVHYTAIEKNGGRATLTEGESVEFEIVQSPKGPKADRVVRLGVK